MRSGSPQQQIVVVRVAFLDGWPPELLIELLEVGPERDRDRILARTSSITDAGRAFDLWLRRAFASGDKHRQSSSDDERLTGE